MICAKSVIKLQIGFRYIEFCLGLAFLRLLNRSVAGSMLSPNKTSFLGVDGAG